MATPLPYDIIVREILPKLPAKSLLRFKCVCKSFKTQISCPQFINLHLRQGLSNDSNRFLIAINRKYLICMDMNSLNSPWYNLELEQPFYIYRIFGVGSCNGLICICMALCPGAFSTFMLLNPCTGISLMIPHIQQLIRRPSSYLHFSVNFGFGFDSFDSDFKIVSILDYKIDNFLRIRDVLVYSLNNHAKKSWRLVLSTTPKDIFQYHQDGVLLNNHLLHWIFSCSNNEYRIGCFDLESENWVKDVPLPDYREQTGTDFAVKEDDKLQLGVIDSCLCLMIENLNDKLFDVWMMKEYGVKESWMKLSAISDSFVDNHRTLKNEISVTRDDKIKSKPVKLLFYDAQNKRVRKADQSLKFSGDDLIHASTCQGSLVVLPGGEKIGKWSNDVNKKTLGLQIVDDQGKTRDTSYEITGSR